MKKINFSKIKCIKFDATLSDAKNVMKEFRIRHLPVLDIYQEVVGILSEKDIFNNARLGDLPVEMFMSTPVISIHEEVSIKKLALLMVEKKVSSVLITDDENCMVGIVTSTDLLYHLAHLLGDDEPIAPRSSADWMIASGEFSRRLSEIGI